MAHIPVLLKEVIKYLDPQPNDNFIDATFGEGGHSLALLQNNQPEGRILAIERDDKLFQNILEGKTNFPINEPAFRNRIILVNDSYTNLEQIVKEHHFTPVKGILFDLGMCSWQIDESRKGFSYLKDEPLDMRFNSKDTLTAAEIVNLWSEEEIENILRKYGEERYSQRIAHAIKEARRKHRLIGTKDLIEVIQQAVPRNYDHHRLFFGARTFQALRIAVNNELENIRLGLEQAWRVLPSKGRLVVISFHSLEDRIVKQFFQEKFRQKQLELLTKKPLVPSFEEIKQNSRAHSAKLRAGIKLI